MSVSLKISLRHLPNSDEKRRYTHDVIHSKLDSTGVSVHGLWKWCCGNGDDRVKRDIMFKISLKNLS